MPELPTSTDINTQYHNTNAYQISPVGSNEPHRPRGRARGASTASRVAIDYFDPEGVNDLRRTITQQSAAARSTRSGRSASRRRAPSVTGVSEGATSSTSTIAAEEDAEKFDLEKFLKGLVQRCMFFFHSS